MVRVSVKFRVRVVRIRERVRVKERIIGFGLR
jgi:hypothetical protein